MMRPPGGIWRAISARRLDRGVIGRVHIDPQQPVDRIRIQFECVAEQGDPGIDHQYVERTALAYHVDDGVPVGAVGLQRRAAGGSGDFLRGGRRAGIREADPGAVRREAPYDCRADAAASTKDQHRFVLERTHGNTSMQLV
jgi:hypothetical protein